MMAGNQPKLTDWLTELQNLKETYESDAYSNRETAIRTIEKKMEECLLESNNYLKQEESEVQQLIGEGKVCLPAHIKWPVPLKCPEFLPSDSQSCPIDETTSMISSLEFDMSSIAPSDKPDREAQADTFLANLTSNLELPSEVSIEHSVLPLFKRGVGDIAHTPGLTFFSAMDGDKCCLFQWESSESDPVKIPTSFDCLNLCLSGSEELLLPEHVWKEGERKFFGTNRVKRVQLMKDFESTPAEIQDFYEVEDGLNLVGLDSSPEGLVALCDYELKRITIHSTGPWSRVDTFHIDPLLAEQLRSFKAPNDTHLRPLQIHWMDSDRLCVKMADAQTIICFSLKHKHIVWTQSVPKAQYLTAAYNRLFVSHKNKPSRFTVLQADSGKILSDECFTSPGPKWSLKVFPSPAGGGNVVAFSC